MHCHSLDATIFHFLNIFILEVRSQQDWFFLRAVGEGSVLGLSLWLIDGPLFFVPLKWQTPHVCACIFSPFYRGTCHSGLVHTLMTSF